VLEVWVDGYGRRPGTAQANAAWTAYTVVMVN